MKEKIINPLLTIELVLHLLNFAILLVAFILTNRRFQCRSKEQFGNDVVNDVVVVTADMNA